MANPEATGISPVSLKRTYFFKENRPFLPVGAHWVPAKAALQWPYQWDEQDIEADFAKMKELGFNTVRFDLFWAWFEPRPGDYNQTAFEQFDFLIRLGYKYGLYLHPTLFVGGEVGEAFWDVPWRNGRHPHADPEMLRLQTEHAAEFARRYRGEPVILAWDLTDEPPFWIVSGETSDAMAINWTRLIAGAIRRHDPEHLLCVGTSMEDVARGPFRPDNLAGEVDFFTAHPYSIYTLDRFPDPMLSERGTYCGAFQVTLSAGAGRPVMIHELGASSAQYSPESIAAFDRVSMYSSLAAGANGFLLWCYTDAAPETFHRVPYLRAPHETQFGLTTWDRKDRPAGKMLREFAQLVEKLDLKGIEPAPAEVAIMVPHEWAKPHGDFSRFGLSGAGIAPYFPVQDGGGVAGAPLTQHGELNVWLTGALLSSLILTRRAGYKPAMPREYSHWQDHPALFVPSPLTSTEANLVHVHTLFWETVQEYLAGGGNVYASLCADAAIPEMDGIFGARLLDHAPVEGASLQIVKPFGDLETGEVFNFRLDRAKPRNWPATLEISSGEVIAIDQDGRPALVANQSGKGKTLLCTYPIESYLATQPTAFEGKENTHRLYRAFLEWAGVQPLFRTDVASVEAGALAGEGRGYVVLANHRAEQIEVSLSTRLAISSLTQTGGGQSRPLPKEDGSWKLVISGHGGMILEWKA
ncbi:MAG TPA: beta-galactosidase [Anaerolineales bacterium]|jgi:endo-1,4-beta-mannosidase